MDEFEEMYLEASKWAKEILSEANITTDKNKRNEFKGIIQELYKLANKHNNSMDDFIRLTEKNIRRTEFGIQSYCICKRLFAL